MVRREAVQLVEQIAATCESLETVRIMEVCGTHTVNLFRSGIRSLLPPEIHLISGPGCPVCVTSQGYIDAACELSNLPDVTICTYGDMVRVPGRMGSLEHQRGRGAKVAVIYSARDALKYAMNNPDRKIVFLAIGFETTAPATAATVLEADRLGVDNFFILAGHKLVIPAMDMLLSSDKAMIDGFLCPGHVSVVIGAGAYRPIAEQYHKPCVVTGFEPQQMLRGILHLVRQVARDQARVENVYSVAVTEGGNPAALALIERVFLAAPALWRAMGILDASGLELRGQYRRFDAVEHFGVEIGPDVSPPGCLCGEVIQGISQPGDCPLFGRTCSPLEPVGPCMVSSEGTCAAWYKYNRHTNAFAE